MWFFSYKGQTSHSLRTWTFIIIRFFHQLRMNNNVGIFWDKRKIQWICILRLKFNLNLSDVAMPVLSPILPALFFLNSYITAPKLNDVHSHRKDSTSMKFCALVLKLGLLQITGKTQYKMPPVGLYLQQTYSTIIFIKIYLKSEVSWKFAH